MDPNSELTINGHEASNLTEQPIVPPPVPNHLINEHQNRTNNENNWMQRSESTVSSSAESWNKESIAPMVVQSVVFSEEVHQEEQPQAMIDTNAKDPAKSRFFPVRMFRGFCYALNALKLCFKEGFVWIALCETVMIGVALLLNLVLGIISGYFIVDRLIWNKPLDRSWHWALKIIPYNWFVLWSLLITAACLFFTFVYFMIGFIPFRAMVDAGCKRLSALVEKKMKLQTITVTDIVLGEIDDSELRINNDSLLISWLWQWFRLYIRNSIQSCSSQFKGIIRTTIRRAIIRTIVFVIVNTLGIGLGFFIPGFGFLLSIACFLVTSSLNAALIGLDIVMDRKEYTIIEAQRTIWNNLSLIIGMGFGILIVGILPGGVFLLFPVAIIASTRLLNHLEQFERSGKNNPYWYIPLVNWRIPFL